MTNPFKVSIKIFVLGIIFTSLSCVEPQHTVSPSGYDLNKPEKFNMPQNLFEISGIIMNQGDPKQIFAIQDEDGDLFHFALGDKADRYTRFGGKGDYEDLTIVNNHVIVLKSNGELHVFPLSEINKAEATQVKKIKDLVPKAEYEGIATDPKNGLVYILTKDSKADSKNKSTTIYVFKFMPDATLKANGQFAVSHKEIEKISGADRSKFRPSALAKNPLTNEWYILSSINKSIVVTDQNFKIKEVYPLSGSFFNQPEGIAFDKNNNLYISNEGGTLSAGNILKFAYKK